MAAGTIRFDRGFRFDAGHRFDEPPVVPPPAAPVLPAPQQKKGTTHMDFIPDKRSDQLAWHKNIRDNIEEEGPKFGLSPTEITAAKNVAAAQVTLMETTDAAKAALDGARAAERAGTPGNEAAIRGMVRNWKTRPGFAASGSEGVLKLKGSASTFDPGTFKPVIKVVIEGGQIRVEFTKGKTDGVIIYSRLRGAVGWTKLGLDTDSPYYDTRPLAVPNQPETREYMARGVLDDEEIGLDSDIVSVVFGG